MADAAAGIVAHEGFVFSMLVPVGASTAWYIVYQSIRMRSGVGNLKYAPIEKFLANNVNELVSETVIEAKEMVGKRARMLVYRVENWFADD